MKQSRLAVNIIFFINGFIFANWAARLPLLQDTYDINHKMLGFVLLSASLGALFAMPFTGWLISKNGSQKITQRAAFLYLCIVPFIPLSPNYWTLMTTFFIMGMMTGTLDVAMNAQAVVVEKAYQKPIMSFFHAMFSAGMMIGAGSGALFERFEVSLFYHFLAIVLLSIAAYIWCVRHLMEDEVAEEEKEASFFKLPDPALIGIGVIAFCCMLGEGAMADWSSNYMTRIVEADLSTAPLGLFAFSLAMMIGRFLGDAARVRFGDQNLLFFGGLFAMSGIALIVFLPATISAIFGFFLIGVGLSSIVPIAYSQAGNMPGIAPGVGIGMVTTIGYAGFLFGPPIIGFLADWQNLRIAFMFILGLFFAMTSLAWIQRQRKQKKRLHESTIRA
ncbi:MAG: MFS transporter [Bacteroidota bacterium]